MQYEELLAEFAIILDQLDDGFANNDKALVGGKISDLHNLYETIAEYGIEV